MGFFSKNQKDNFGFIINTDDEPIKISGAQGLTPNAITADEITNPWKFDENDKNSSQPSALDSLKKRMNVTQTNPKQENNDLTVKNNPPKHDVESSSQPQVSSNKTTLVEKVKRYTIDEQGHNVSENQKPLYELESVAEILLNNGENVIKNLSKKYGVDVVMDDLKKDSSPQKTASSKEKFSQNPSSNSQKPKASAPTPDFKRMVIESEAREEKQLYENLLQEHKPTQTPDFSLPDISDIDTNEVGIKSDDTLSNTSTIRFTPIKNALGHTDHISISSATQYIDLNDNIPDEIQNVPETTLEASEFDSYIPSSEYCDDVSGKKILRKLAIKKRSYFLSGFVSLIAILALSFFLIPAIYDFIISNPKSAMFVCTSILFVAFLANVDMVLNLRFLLCKKCDFDVLALLASFSSILLGVISAISHENSYYITLACSILLFVRSVFKFKDASTKYNSIKQIIGEQNKNAVTLISDSATTFAMAKNSIEGDALIATHKKARFVSDFFKHYDFSPMLSGKISIVFFATLALSLLSGLMAYFYYDDIHSAFYIASCITIIAAIPSVFFIDVLPLSSAAKKLNKSGAMIAGIYGAKKIENANAVTININDIFPENTVTMHNMKVLSNNNIDDILLRAASLTSAVNSPLSHIFKKIAGTNTSYSIPNSDTVKYEKNLGISGWVDNELLFIGNRSLMRAHGIEIPSLEVDKKILRQGYFPVYVATANTACALIVIQYNVNSDVAKQLHKTTNMGITLLVENCDPNITEEMICDYFGIYDGSIKIMSNSGVYMMRNVTLEVDKCSAPAAFKGSGLNFIKIINSSSAIKNSNRLLSVFYSVFAVFGVLYFIYSAFSGIMSIPAQTTVLLYSLGTTILSIIGFLIRKP